jgi:hypothetical protein
VSRLIAVLALGLASCGGSPAPTPVMASNTAEPGGETAAPTGALAGTYIAKHPTMVMCEDGSGVDCEEAGEDHLVIRNNADGTIAVELETLGTNYHTCTFEGTLKPVDGGESYQYSAAPASDEGECELTLGVTDKDLTISASGCSYYCGMRATLDSSFERH